MTEKELCMEFFTTAHRFKKIHMDGIFPEISKGEFWALKMIQKATLKSEGGCGGYVSTIAEHLKVTPSAISRMLKGLEERELIVREIDKNDRRNTYVTLTEKGEVITKEVEAAINEFTQSIILAMGEEDSKTLIKLFNKLVDVMEAEVKQRSKTKG
ncbi:MAG: MarR family transcriptional regulator [Candidatus Cellulosilyticum pullistercoris]|uniref:MarR family transcriptional regulator n=1 Tax=Candidatus Cellulosilyticum pullistercoris TaxID=2838521 RepID=A0A9E2KC01_9FIRM|nr:MarR family transcriptional regulator [Candidatus Cellulosilyticum pullistercoris]